MQPLHPFPPKSIKTMSEEIDIPGTARLFTETGEALSNEIHLIPAPSSDPEDPLNWTQKRKYFNLFCVLLYSIATGILSSVLYSVYTPLGEENGLTLDQLNAGQGYMYLFIGVCCLFTTPLALCFGKKPMYVVTCIASGLVNLWVIYGKGNGQWIICRLLVGLCISPQFALVEISIADVVSNRGWSLASTPLNKSSSCTSGRSVSVYIVPPCMWESLSVPSFPGTSWTVSGSGRSS